MHIHGFDADSQPRRTHASRPNGERPEDAGQVPLPGRVLRGDPLAESPNCSGRLASAELLRAALVEAERRVERARLSFEQSEPGTARHVAARVYLADVQAQREVLQRALAAAEGATR